MTRDDFNQLKKAVRIVERLQVWISHLVDQGKFEREDSPMLHACWNPDAGVSIFADYSTETRQRWDMLWSSDNDEAETLTLQVVREYLDLSISAVQCPK